MNTVCRNGWIQFVIWTTKMRNAVRVEDALCEFELIDSEYDRVKFDCLKSIGFPNLRIWRKSIGYLQYLLKLLNWLYFSGMAESVMKREDFSCFMTFYENAFFWVFRWCVPSVVSPNMSVSTINVERVKMKELFWTIQNNLSWDKFIFWWWKILFSTYFSRSSNEMHLEKYFNS